MPPVSSTMTTAASVAAMTATVTIVVVMSAMRLRFFDDDFNCFFVIALLFPVVQTAADE